MLLNDQATVAHVDNVYEWAGYQLGAMFHDTIWTGIFLALPLSVIVGGFIWTIVKALRKHDYEQVPMYLVYMLVVTWLIWPVEIRYGMRVMSGEQLRLDALSKKQGMQEVKISVPRILGWVSSVVDGVVGRVILKIDGEFGEKVKDFNRTAAIVSYSRIQNPEVEKKLLEFVKACYIPALALKKNNPDLAYIQIQDPEDIMFDRGLSDLYNKIKLTEKESCWTPHFQFLDYWLPKELYVAGSHHFQVLRSLGTIKYKEGLDTDFIQLYKKRIIKNTIMQTEMPPFAPNEMFFANTAFRRPPNEGVGSTVKSIAEGFADMFAWFGRHMQGYAINVFVVSFAPAFYGMVMMIIIGFFPMIALVALLPYKTMILVRYFKVLLGVKLWPVLWSVLASFYNSGSLEEVLMGTDRPSSALFIATAMYLLVPAISVGIIELSASFSTSAISSVAHAAQSAATGAVAAIASMAMRYGPRAIGAGANQVRQLAGAVGSGGGGVESIPMQRGGMTGDPSGVPAGHIARYQPGIRSGGGAAGGGGGGRGGRGGGRRGGGGGGGGRARLGAARVGARR